MHPLIAQLRRQYPLPMQFDRFAPYDPACYCVGGTLVLSTPQICDQVRGAKERTFPGEDTLAAAIALHNPRLTEHAAYAYAEAVLAYNDRGQFEAAWAYLGDALEGTATASPATHPTEDEPHVID